jgi:hypothetical protein
VPQAKRQIQEKFEKLIKAKFKAAGMSETDAEMLKYQGKLDSLSDGSDRDFKNERFYLAKRRDEIKKEKGVFSYSFINICYQEDKIAYMLTFFLLDDLVEKIIASKYKALNTLDRELVEVRKIKKEDVRNIEPLRFPRPIIETKEFETAEDSSEYWEYEIKVNSLEIQNFVHQHVVLWEKSKFNIESRNIRKPEIQLSSFVDELFKKLRSYPQEELIIEYKFDEKDHESPKEEWFFSCLFLEKIKCVEIIEIKIQKKLYGSNDTDFIFLKINILDKFFEDFEMDLFTPKFDFTYLTSGVRSDVSDKEIINKETKPLMDLDRSILNIEDYEIKIQKLSNQYHLLSILSQDPSKNWEFSEIAELIDREREWKKWYNVADAIKKKVSITTKGQIEDFLITTTSAVQINPSYI